MLNIRKFLTAIGLVPAASSGIDSKGEVEVLSTGGHLRYHNGTTASNVLTADHADTVVAKTINAPDNTITNILDVNVGTAAGITYNKLSLTDSIKNSDVSSVAAIDATKIADGSVSSTEFQYLDGVTSSIQTQLDSKASTTLNSAHIYVGNVSNVATDVAVSGDFLIDNAGVTAIASGVIVDADVSSTAAIAYSKLSLTDSIKNSDVSSVAAIARTKIANGTANHVVINDGSGTLSSEASLAETRGGTHQTTYTTGDLLYASASNTLSKLSVGSNSQVLTVSAGIPSWANSGGSSGSGIGSGGIGTLITTDYAVQLSDASKLLPVQTTIAITITLPSPASVGAGYNVTIKDYSGLSASFPIGVFPNGAELIDGGDGSDSIATAYQAVTYMTDGTNWYRTVNYSTGASLGVRGVFAGGTIGGDSNVIDYVVINTTGNATDFGDLTTTNYALAGCSSATRGLFGGGINNADGIDYITIASAGNAINFGDLNANRTFLGAASNNTRGLFAGGGSQLATTDYVTIASVGNATNFGNLTVGRVDLSGCASSTRALFAGDENGGNIIDYYTIASTGTATDFGDQTVARRRAASCANLTRGIWAGGRVSSTPQNTIDYVTIASAGNATDFGDLSLTRMDLAGTANSTRGIFGGGDVGAGAATGRIDYITIASTGNATTFGDLTVAKSINAACSSYGK